MEILKLCERFTDRFFDFLETSFKKGEFQMLEFIMVLIFLSIVVLNFVVFIAASGICRGLRDLVRAVGQETFYEHNNTHS
jgi:hypothetical protein